MRKLTISLDDRIAAWLRREAAARHLSLPRFIAELLQGHWRAGMDDGMDGRAGYEAARRAWMARKPVPLSAPGERYPTRAEVHERHS